MYLVSLRLSTVIQLKRLIFGRPPAMRETCVNCGQRGHYNICTHLLQLAYNTFVIDSTDCVAQCSSESMSLGVSDAHCCISPCRLIQQIV